MFMRSIKMLQSSAFCPARRIEQTVAHHFYFDN